MKQVLEAINNDRIDFDYGAKWLTKLRMKWAKAPNIDDIDPAKSLTCDSPLRGGLLSAWAENAGGPAKDICKWLFEGAPSGILHSVPDYGIFPPKEPGEHMAISESEGQYIEPGANYSSLEEDSEAEEVIAKITDPAKSGARVADT